MFQNLFFRWGKSSGLLVGVIGEPNSDTVYPPFHCYVNIIHGSSRGSFPNYIQLCDFYPLCYRYVIMLCFISVTRYTSSGRRL